MGFNLVKLKYAYGDLEPYISADIMKLHYEKHYVGYCNKLNEFLSSMVKSLDVTCQIPSIVELLKSISKYDTVARNNGGGYYNHSLFWQFLTPLKKESFSLSETKLFGQIASTFGDFTSFQVQFMTEGLGVFGSGWVWLVLNSKRELEIIATPNQDNPIMDIYPDNYYILFGIDVWEHAYYLQYYNDRKSYLKQIWNIINWEYIDYLYNYYKSNQQV